MSAPDVPALRMTAVVYHLCWRELARFFRQRNRVIGSIGTPLVMWIIFGLGLDRSFSAGTSSAADAGFLHYYFPGSLVLILMFTAIFTSISIIEDRREGFLQSVLVSPVSRSSMVLGKVLGGAIIALIQALLFLSVALFLDVSWSPGRFLALVVLLFAAALDDDKLGICVCLADGVHSGIPCYYELSIDAHVVNVRVVFSSAGVGGFKRCSNGRALVHADKPVDVCGGFGAGVVICTTFG